MVSESHSNSLGWKSRLEALDSWPGEGLHKDAAWEKLHKRLREKPSPKKAVWYWIAAACTLSAFFMPGLFSVKNDTSLVKNTIQPKQSTRPFISPSKKIFKKDTLEVVSGKHFYRKRRKLYIAKVNKIILPAANNVITAKPLANNMKISLPQIANNIIAADTFHNIVIKVAYKPTLRVIHINELEQLSAAEKFALNTSVKWPVKITNKDVFSGFSTGTNSDYNILKINLSPQN